MSSPLSDPFIPREGWAEEARELRAIANLLDAALAADPPLDDGEARLLGQIALQLIREDFAFAFTDEGPWLSGLLRRDLVELGEIEDPIEGTKVQIPKRFWP